MGEQEKTAEEESGGRIGYTIGVAFLIIAVSALARIGWMVGGALANHFFGVQL